MLASHVRRYVCNKWRIQKEGKVKRPPLALDFFLRKSLFQYKTRTAHYVNLRQMATLG